MDIHRHQCPKCGCIWRHDGDSLIEKDAAHRCPVEGCGGEQLWHYEYDFGAVDFDHDGVDTIDRRRPR